MCSTMILDDFAQEVNDLLQTYFHASASDYDLEEKVRQWWLIGLTPDQAFRQIEELILADETAQVEHAYTY